MIRLGSTPKLSTCWISDLLAQSNPKPSDARSSTTRGSGLDLTAIDEQAYIRQNINEECLIFTTYQRKVQCAAIATSNEDAGDRLHPSHRQRKHFLDQIPT